MNIRIIIAISLVLTTFITNAQEQVVIDAPRNILEALSIKGDGLGIITINQPEYMRALVISQSDKGKALLSSDGNISVVKGYRIQIYNGNLSQSKQEAYKRADKIKKQFQSLGVYITYKAPFWRVLIGDFLSEDEAKEFMKSIIHEIPEYKREIYIVPSSIRLTNTYMQDSQY